MNKTKAPGGCQLKHSNSLSFWNSCQSIIKIFFNPLFQQMKKQNAVSSWLGLKQCGGRNEKQSGFPITANKRLFRREEITKASKEWWFYLKWIKSTCLSLFPQRSWASWLVLDQPESCPCWNREAKRQLTKAGKSSFCPPSHRLEDRARQWFWSSELIPLKPEVL